MEKEPIDPNYYSESHKHEVRKLEVNKLALSREDDKRISKNVIASYAIGHYKVWGCE